MKNLFFIHSHITYFVSKAIINTYNYKKDEILFVISRNYNNSEIKNFDLIDITIPHDDLDTFGPTNFFNKHKNIHIIDRLINNHLIENQNFRAYLPHVFHPAMQIIASHNRCKQLNIIEEGINAYSKYLMHNKEQSVLKKVVKTTLNFLPFIGKKRIFFIKNFDLRKFPKATLPQFFSVTSKGFLGLSHKVNRIKMQPIENLDYDISRSSVIVLEGAVEQGNMALDTMLKGIKSIIDDIDDNCIYLKYHPAQIPKNRKKIETLIKNSGLKVRVIPDEIAFEQIVITNNNLKVYGFTTSLLLYAHEYGCKVSSYENKLIKDHLFKTFRAKNNFDLKSLING